MSTNEKSTALVKYQPRQSAQARMNLVMINGHAFYRDAGWLCPCGMRRPATWILEPLPPCTRRLD